MKLEKLNYPGCFLNVTSALSLNFCHKSNNIPGKFIAYMRAGLPVLASVNAGNEIIQMINKNGVGYACCV